MRVIGIDPGLTRCGIAVISASHPSRPQLLGVGVVRSSPDLELPMRLLVLEQGLSEWFDEYEPTSVAVERVFAQNNLASVMGTGQAAGIAMLVAARRRLPVSLYTPSEAKAAITGSGRADKAQVGFMVSRILGLAKSPKPADAADAVALAMCHMWRGGGASRVRQAARRAAIR